MHFSSLVGLSAFVAQVSAHGYVQQIKFGSSDYIETWNPYKDPQKGTTINRITRKFLDNGPVTDNLFATNAITCNFGAKDAANNVPVDATHSVAAGSDVVFLWTDWQSDHPGPIMTYLARCPGKCLNFKGDTGNVWVKIHQEGYDASKTPPWASKRLPTQNSTWAVKLPSSIVAGEYLLRHEILGLQRTNTDGKLAQFYPSCNQITVTGGGSTNLPTGIALPGAYNYNDPGIFLEYRDISATNPYTPPGGPVWTDKGWST